MSIVRTPASRRPWLFHRNQLQRLHSAALDDLARGRDFLSRFAGDLFFDGDWLFVDEEVERSVFGEERGGDVAADAGVGAAGVPFAVGAAGGVAMQVDDLAGERHRFVIGGGEKGKEEEQGQFFHGFQDDPRPPPKP